MSIGAALVVIETEGDFSAAEAPALEPVTDTVKVAPTSAEQVEVAEQYEAENPGVEAASPSPLRGEGRGEGTSATGGAPSVPAQPLSPTLSPEGEREKVVLASPAVRARAADLGIDLAQVKTEGDRVRHADLDAFLRYGQGQGYHAPHVSHARADEAIKVIGMRRRIAENMAASKRAIPHFTYVEEIDVTALEAMRADLNGARGSRPKLTMLPLLIAAICKTVPAFPMINARYDDEAGVVTRHGAVHLGMATQTDAGLTVPVIRDAQDRNVWQLAAEILRLAEAARANKLKPDEMGGGTLTVTSLGPLGGIATTPVINRPEVAIIGPNKIVERPVFVGDEIVRAKLMNLSISCDHRVVDGWDAASFVQALKRYLETPVLLFAD